MAKRKKTKTIAERAKDEHKIKRVVDEVQASPAPTVKTSPRAVKARETQRLHNEAITEVLHGCASANPSQSQRATLKLGSDDDDSSLSSDEPMSNKKTPPQPSPQKKRKSPPSSGTTARKLPTKKNKTLQMKVGRRVKTTRKSVFHALTAQQREELKDESNDFILCGTVLTPSSCLLYTSDAADE